MEAEIFLQLPAQRLSPCLPLAFFPPLRINQKFRVQMGKAVKTSPKIRSYGTAPKLINPAVTRG